MFKDYLGPNWAWSFSGPVYIAPLQEIFSGSDDEFIIAYPFDPNVALQLQKAHKQKLKEKIVEQGHGANR